jgi:DNA ligase-1
MTLLAHVVAASLQVAATSSRNAKVRLLADALASLSAEELEIAVTWLSGDTRQGRVGIGPAALRANIAAPAATPSLTLAEVDSQIGELATVRGAGSAARRAAQLQTLFGRATADEQDFLLKLLLGELRQGALAGVMLDTIAAVTRIPAVEVRRAAMYESRLGVVARTGLESGAAGLQAFQLQLMSPIAPVGSAGTADGRCRLRMEDGRRADPGSQARRSRPRVHTQSQ